MDPRNPDLLLEQDEARQSAADTAGSVAVGIRLGSTAVRAAGEVVPVPLRAAGRVARIVDEAAQGPSPSKAENITCAAASVAVTTTIAAPFVAAATQIGAAAGGVGGGAAGVAADSIPGALTGASIGAVVGGVLAGSAVYSIVTEAARPVGDAARSTCHTVFDKLRGREKAGICVATALHKEITKQNVEHSLATSVATMAHNGSASRQFLAPIAESFCARGDSEAQQQRSITPLIAASLGVAAGTAMVQLGVGAPIAAPLTAASGILAARAGNLAHKMAEVTTKAIDKNIEKTTHLKKWVTKSVRDFYKEVSSNIQIIGEAKAEEVFDEELKKYTATNIKTLSEQNVSADEMLLFGRALQKGLEDEWQDFVDKKTHRTPGVNLSPDRVLGDLKWVKSEIEEADLHKQVRDSASQTGEMPGEQQSMDRLIVDLLTEIDISGFEHVAEITTLKSELDAQKQSATSTQLDILQAAQKLNNAKAKVAEAERRKEEYIRSAHYCVDIATNVAYLLGNSKRAQQISVIGNALINVASVIASAVTINPLLAASTILGACVSVKSLFGRNKGQDGNRMILDAIRALGEQLQVCRREMHERFDQVMSALDDINGNIVRGFLSLEWKADNILEQIQVLRAEVSDLSERQANTGATVIGQLTQLQRSIERQSQVDEVTKLFTMTEKAIRDHAFQAKYSDYTAEVEAHALASNVGAKHVSIVGSSAVTKAKDLPAFLKLVTDNSLQNRSGYFALNTLLSYLDGLSLATDYHYHDESVAYLLEQLTKDNQNVICSPVLGLGNLLIDEPDLGDRSGTQATSLIGTITNLDSTGSVLQLIPIQHNGEWHLLVVDTWDETFHYYGSAEPTLLNRLLDVYDDLEGRGHWGMELHASRFEVGLDCQATALLLMKQCGEIVARKPLANVSTTLTKTEAAQLHVQNADKLRAAQKYPQPYDIPANPLVWQYLSHALIYLVSRQYPDAHLAALSTDEIARMQRFICEGSAVLGNLSRLRNDDYISLLVGNYENAAVALVDELEHVRKLYEKKLSVDRATDNKKVLAAALFDTTSLATQYIAVSTEYSNIEGPNGSTKKGAGRWFDSSSHEQRVGNVTTHLSYNDSYSVGERLEQKRIYKTTREDEIKSSKGTYAAGIKKEMEKADYICEIDLCAGVKSFSRHLPACLYPAYPGHPILPMPRGGEFLKIVPDVYYQAQMMQLGIIKCTYQIINNNQFVLKAHFIEGDSTLSEHNLISSLTIPYRPSFFQGNEAIWWWYYGGNYCDNLNSVSTYAPTTLVYAKGRVWTNKTVLIPICTKHNGCYHVLDQHVKNVQYEPEKQRQMEGKIKETIKGLQDKWYEQLRKTIASENVSSLGTAVATFDACARMLSLLSEIALADKVRLDVFTLFMNQHPALVFNRGGLLNMLETCPAGNIEELIVPNAKLRDLLTSAQSFLQKMRWRLDFPLFDGAKVIDELLESMDLYVPKMRIGLSISSIAALQEQILAADNILLGNAAQNIRAIRAQTSDPAIISGLDALAANVDQHRAVQSEIRARIASGATDLLLLEGMPRVVPTLEAAATAPIMAGYSQHGLLGTRARVIEVHELSIDMGRGDGPTESL